jgi:hypothetical protein
MRVFVCALCETCATDEKMMEAVNKSMLDRCGSIIPNLSLN